jgi:hypothetical protein
MISIKFFKEIGSIHFGISALSFGIEAHNFNFGYDSKVLEEIVIGVPLNLNFKNEESIFFNFPYKFFGIKFDYFFEIFSLTYFLVLTLSLG